MNQPPLNGNSLWRKFSGNKNIPKSSVKGSEKGSEKSSVKIIELIKEASVVRLTLLDIWLLGKAAFIRCLPMRIKYKGISDALH